MPAHQTGFSPSEVSLASGLRVIEIGESIAAALAGMILADYGAEVIMVEPPRGSRLRDLAAFPMWARGKRSATLDLAQPSGRDQLLQLSADADVVIAALTPSSIDELGADASRLRGANTRLVHCEITGFGRDHPLSNVPGYEGIVASRGGRAHEFSVLFEGERPAFPAVPVATYGAAMVALQGIFAALLERRRSGQGQAIATSLLGALAVFDMSFWVPGSSRALRLADAPLPYYAVARTGDGVWLQFSQNSPKLFRAFARALELDHLLDEPRFRTAPSLADPEDARAFRAYILERVAERSWADWQVVFARDPDLSAEPFAWPGDALAHPQLVHTGDSAEPASPQAGVSRWLGPLVTCSSTPARTPQPAPAQAASWSEASADQPLAWTTNGVETSVDPGDASTDGPPLLRGALVLELATWIATPIATALLCDLGARVIKIEPLEGDPMRQHGPSSLKVLQGKESIALDLKTPEGREIVHRLAARADVLAHNYRPGVPERLGIDYPTLRRLNPGLVHIYAASYGSSGPMSARPAFHVTAGAVCGGVLAQSGGAGPPAPGVELSEEESARWSQYLSRCNEANPDFNGGLAVAAAAAMGLYARSRTGEGQALETRMMASNAYTLSEYFVDSPNGAARVFPDAELYGLHALYRLYRAEQGWVFVAAPGDEAFARLCTALDCPKLAEDARFATASDRAGHDDELSGELAALFAREKAASWEQRLASRGIGCVEVHDGPHAAYVFDADWGERLGFVDTAAAVGKGPYLRYGRAIHSPAQLGPPGAADIVGAQTRSILAEIGYSDAEVEDLVSRGVVVAADPT